MHIPELDLSKRGEFLIGTPEEKLNYMIRNARSVKDLRTLARSLDELAQLYDDQSRYSEAELGYLLTIEILQKIQLKDDPELGLEYERLASHYVKCGDLERAGKANFKALTILRKHANEDPIELAIVLHNQAWLESSTRTMSKAKRYLFESLKMLKQQFGSNHLMVGMAANALAEFYMKEGELGKAEQYFEMALEIVPQSSVPKEITSTIMSNYVLVLRKNHKYSAAKQIEERAKSSAQ